MARVYAELTALCLLLLLCTGLAALASLRAPALHPVAAGHVAAGPAFLSGLYAPEQAPDGSTFRWTEGAALVQLRGAFHVAPAYEATLRLRADHPAGPQPLTLLVGGRAVATVAPQERFRTYRLLVGPDESHAELWLGLQTPTFVAPGNPRPLGVLLSDLGLRPLVRLAPLAVAWLAGGLAALWAVLRGAGLPARHRLSLVALAGLGLAASAAFARPTPLPVPMLGALALAGVAGAALVARQLAARLALAALVLLVALGGVIWPSWLSDDAFISFRYAQNLAAGHGLVYNGGERVEGYTNFLWTVLAAGVLRLGGDLVLWCYASGVALGLAIVLLTYRLAARLLEPPWALVAALVVGTSQSMLLYTARGSGLETGLFTLLLLAASERYLAAYGKRRAPLVAAGLLLAAAALTRPEGVLVFALTAGHLLLWPWHQAPGTRHQARGPLSSLSPLSSLVLRLAPLVLAFLLVFAPYFLWRVSYYGDLLPNTFYAKTGGGLRQLVRGLEYAGAFALTLGGPLLLVVAAPWLGTWRVALASWRGYLLPLVLVYSAYIVAVGGDHFRGERFFVPLLPWLALLLADGLATGYRFFNHTERGSVAGASAGIISGKTARQSTGSINKLSALSGVNVLLALGLATGSIAALVRTQPIDITIQGLDESVWIWREIGWWLADEASPDASVAAAGAGAVAFYGQRETVDLYGLTDKHIGRLAVAEMGAGVAGHEKRDPLYVLNEREPSYIPRIWDDYFGGAAALQERYQLISVTTRSGRSLELWQRRR